MNPKIGSFVHIAHASPRYNIVMIECNPYDGVRIKAIRYDGKAVFTLPEYILREANVDELATFYTRRIEHLIATAAQTKADIQACRGELAKLAAYQASVGRD